MNQLHFTTLRSITAGVLLLALLGTSGCKKIEDHLNALQPYAQVNLVANNDEYVKPVQQDATLQNAWGLVFSPTGIPWIASQAGHVGQVYNSEGVTLIPPVHIPSPGSLDGGGNPTGIVFNGASDAFIIPAGNGGAAAAARFIYAGVDGVIAAWNGTWGEHAYRVATTTGVYTGLAIGHSGGVNYLYGANIKDGRIDVWDGAWNAASLSFKDPFLPANYAPFNIQAVGDNLYVTYAKVSAGEEEKGVGKGLVDVFTMGGKFVKRFATGGKLNAPWGVTWAPASFDHHGRELVLVGNFGDGRINAYESDGKFLGQLMRPDHTTIEIEGLWALQFPPYTSTIDPNRLYFTAGPDDEQDGLFGYLTPFMSDNKGGY